MRFAHSHEIAASARSEAATALTCSAAVERRIDSVCMRAAAGPIDQALSADIDDVLNAGCVCALRLDAGGRRLQELLDALGTRVHRTGNAEEVTRDVSSVEESARRLRTRLALLRSLAGRGHVRT